MIRDRTRLSVPTKYLLSDLGKYTPLVVWSRIGIRQYSSVYANTAEYANIRVYMPMYICFPDEYVYLSVRVVWSRIGRLTRPGSFKCCRYVSSVLQRVVKKFSILPRIFQIGFLRCPNLARSGAWDVRFRKNSKPESSRDGILKRRQNRHPLNLDNPVICVLRVFVYICFLVFQCVAKNQRVVACCQKFSVLEKIRCVAACCIAACCSEKRELAVHGTKKER